MKIRAEALRVTYPGSPPVTAVDGVDLVVETGEVVAVVGRSGSGKTSLLHALGGLIEPSGGRVLLDASNISTLPERERDRIRAVHIRFVFQDPHLLDHRSVVANAAMGALYQGRGLRTRRARASVALRAVDLGGREARMAATLSGGERQRVGLARALVAEPAVILADEPTGNLDSETASVVIDLVRRIRDDGGTTVVIATHDPAVEAAADRSLRLRDGKISTA